MSKVELRDDTKDANFNENWLFPISGIKAIFPIHHAKLS